jgi:hypothetical protein
MLAILLASKILKNSSSKWVEALESTQKVDVPFLLCIMHLKTIEESENGGMHKSKLSLQLSWPCLLPRQGYCV